MHTNAYHCGAQDGFELIQLESLLVDPGKELSRVFSIMAESGQGTSEKFSMISKFLPFAFRLGILRKVIVEFFMKVDLRSSLSTKPTGIAASSSGSTRSTARIVVVSLLSAVGLYAVLSYIVAERLANSV